MSRRNRGGDGGEGTWLNTYADMVTLLLTFFVVLFSMSSVEQEKFDALIRSFATPGGTSSSLVIVTPDTPTGSEVATNTNSASEGEQLPVEENPTNMDELYRYLKNYVDKADSKSESGSGVEVAKGDGIVYIRFYNDVFFKPDSDVLLDSSTEPLTVLGSGLKNMEDQIRLIKVSGFTADTFIEDYSVDDWDLSSGRAASVAKFLDKKMDISKKLLVTTGYGVNNPIGDNSTVEGRQKNRRVELTIVGNDTTISVDSVLNGTYDSDRYPASGSDQLLFPDELSSQESSSPEVASSEPGTTSHEDASQ